MPTSKDRRLAIDGGTPARSKSMPPMYPGGMAIAEAEEQAVLDVLHNQRLFRYYGARPGPSKVDQLEQAFAAHIGVPHTLAVTSGTAALLCALQGIGVGPGDEVIIPGYTWIVSASAVLTVGAVPVLAEVDETLTLDPADVERKITPYTRAIIAVHMRGAPCRMDALSAIAQRHGLRLIEDVAQAAGGSFGGKHLGSIGDAGCFSFQFNKIMTSGEGGILTTNDEQILNRAAQYHDVVEGLRKELPAEELLWGVNFRMPELLAAVALVQLGRLDGLLEAMRERKRILKDGLAGVAQQNGIAFREIADPAGDTAIALVFFADNPARAQRIAAALHAENIGAGVIYEPGDTDYHIYAHWEPIMAQRTWTPDGGPWRWAKREITYSKDMCPRTLDLLGRAIHMDVSPLLTNEDLEETLDGLTKVIEGIG